MNDSSTGGFLLPTTSGPLVEDTALDAFLQALVVGVTGMTTTLVRPRWQPIAAPQPEPSVDWCAIGITDEEPYSAYSGDEYHFGRDDSGTNPNGYSITNEWSTLTVLASFYGPNARSNAALMRSGLNVAQNREVFYQTGLALKERAGPLTNVSYVENQQTIRRYDIQFRLNRTVTRVWPIDDLLSAEATINTDEDASQTLVTPVVGSDPPQPF